MVFAQPLPARFRQIGLFACYVLIFFQPFNQFGALRNISAFVLLVCLIGELAIIRPSFKNTTAVRVALALALWIIISSLIGPYPLDSLNVIRKDFLVQALMLTAALTYVRTSADIWRVVAVALAGIGAVTLLSLIEIARYWALNGFSLWIERSHSSFWGGYASTGAFYLPLLAGWLFVAPKNRVATFFGWALSIAIFVLILLYGSRSPLLSAAIAITILLCLLRKWGALMLSLILVISAIAAIQLAQTDNRFKYDTLFKAQTYVTNSGLSARLSVWSGCWQIIQDRPITGYGYGWKKLAWVINEGPYAKRWTSSQPDVAAYFLQEGKASYGRVNPHNYALQVMFEIGIAGFLLVLLFWGEILRQNIALMRRRTPEIQGLATCLFAVLLGDGISNFGNGHWVGGLANLSLVFAGSLLSLTRQEASGISTRTGTKHG